VAGPLLQPGPQQPAGVPEERLLSGYPALDPLDEDLISLQVQVVELEQHRLPDPEAVLVNEIKEGPVPAILDLGEEGFNFILGEILGELLDEHDTASSFVVWLKYEIRL